MSIETQMYEICNRNNYDFTSSVIEFMDTLDTMPIGDSPKAAKSIKNVARQQLREFIESKIPYSLYLPDEISMDYNTIKDMVAAMDADRNLSYNETALGYYTYAETREALKPHFRKFKKAYHSGNFTEKMRAELFGHTIRIKLNHLVLFKSEEECVCDICGKNARFVTMDHNVVKGEEVIFPTLWTVSDENTLIRMTVDHMQARGLGGSNWMDNMVPMCELCNSRKSAIESKIANHNRSIERIKDAKLYPFECRFYC